MEVNAGNKVPAHLAIILDGNGRWAQQRHLPRLLGHRAGLRRLESTIRLAKQRGIRYLSVYAFSTENWNRPALEVEGLMRLFRHYIDRKVAQLKSEGGRIRFAGRRDRISPELQKKMCEAELATAGEQGIDCIICLNYGGRAELIDAIIALADSGHRGEIRESDLRRFLYLPDVPDPDLIVRTSGEIRLSNYWMWESAYSEFYFTDVHWPDFDEKALDSALEDFAKRERRYGGLKS